MILYIFISAIIVPQKIFEMIFYYQEDPAKDAKKGKSR